MKKKLFLMFLVNILMFIGINVTYAESDSSVKNAQCVTLTGEDKIENFDKKCLIFYNGSIDKDEEIKFVITDVIGVNTNNKEALVVAADNNFVLSSDKLEIPDVSVLSSANPYEVTLKRVGPAFIEGSVDLAYVYFQSDDNAEETSECELKYSFSKLPTYTPVIPGDDDETSTDNSTTEKPSTESSNDSTNNNTTTGKNESTSNKTETEKNETTTNKAETQKNETTSNNTSTSSDDKEKNKCEIKAGKYYGPNGELLKDKAAYDKVCGSKNYKDGYGNPYVLLGFGIALIAGVITVSKKNKLFN